MFKPKFNTVNSRRYKRLKADYLLKFKLPGFEGEPVVSNIKDISAGGVKFWTDRVLPEGALIQVSVLLPPLDQELKALGKIVRVRPSKNAHIEYVAVNFLELNLDAQQALNDFIEYIASTVVADDLIDMHQFVKRSV